MGLSASIGAGVQAVSSLLPTPTIPAAPPAPKADDPASRASYEAAQRRRANAASTADARGGTLLTGPLGLTDEPTTRRSTILGS